MEGKKLSFLGAEVTPILDDHGIAYCTPSQAAALLGESRKRIDGMVSAGRLKSTKKQYLLQTVSGRGRRPGYLVLASDVAEARELLLDRLGIKAAMESMQSEIEEVRLAWERDVISLRQRAEEAESQLKLVLKATRSRLDASIAGLEADRQSLAVLGGVESI